MIHIETVSSGDREEWNRYIDKAPAAIAWQVYEWSDVVCHHYNYQFLPIAAREGAEIVGVLPLYLDLGEKKRRLISVPFAVAGGVVADSEAAQMALLEHAVEISGNEGGIPITLKQYKLRMPGEFKTDENYCNYELSLQSDPGILRRQVSGRNMARVAEAEMLGLEVEYPAKDISVFYNLLLKYHLAEGIPCVGEEWIRNLIGFGMYSCALARIQGRVVAATLVKHFKKTVSFPFTCIYPRFAGEGIEIFHSGRLARTQEAPGYRLGWGGLAYPYYYQYYPNTGGQTDFSTRRGWKRKMVSTAWKAMPMAVARRIGPMVVRHFP